MQKLIPVLGIDDDKDDVELMSEALDNASIPDYYFFPDADEFFAIFNPNFRVIIVDLNIPRMNGQAILEKVLKICAKCRVIAVSGVITQEMWMHLQISGAKDFVIKKGGNWADQLAIKVKTQLELAQEDMAEEEALQREEELKRQRDLREYQQVKALLRKK